MTEEQLEEEILSLPEAAVAPLFDETTWLDRNAAERVVGLFTGQGTFTSRERVESDLGAALLRRMLSHSFIRSYAHGTRPR